MFIGRETELGFCNKSIKKTNRNWFFYTAGGVSEKPKRFANFVRISRTSSFPVRRSAEKVYRQIQKRKGQRLAHCHHIMIGFVVGSSSCTTFFQIVLIFKVFQDFFSQIT